MNIIILPTAKKNLKKLPKNIINIILKKLNSIKSDPLRYIERLKESSFWKLRIGDHRAILFIKTKDNEIHVLKIGHRKNNMEQLFPIDALKVPFKKLLKCKCESKGDSLLHFLFPMSCFSNMEFLWYVFRQLLDTSLENDSVLLI